jgi:hypothetical protein
MGLILLADGIKAVDIAHDTSATAEKAKAGKAEKTYPIDAWLNELQRREDHEGLMACVSIFLAGGQKCK